ncbi:MULTISPECIES: hypothetical protein [unclassified Desulfovibrio]|uniref:hypothetical protein n=1 Tax=unclassified Desulfovibrio TaxID=2593640 RepID=UPI002FD8CA88
MTKLKAFRCKKPPKQLHFESVLTATQTDAATKDKAQLQPLPKGVRLKLRCLHGYALQSNFTLKLLWRLREQTFATEA